MLSGLALDNTMVYGEIFHMDAPLRQFRNLCKNFANFALWFMILYEIIKSVITIDEVKKPMETIKKAIFAGILIQMSWFIVAALIDISTVATYAVGGMPMSILKTDARMNSIKILQPDVSMNLNSEKKIDPDDFVVSYQVKTSNGSTVYLSPCDRRVHNKQSYIVGRLYGDEKFINQWKLGLDSSKSELNACVYLGEVKFYYEFPGLKAFTGQAYKTELASILDFDERQGREACGYILKADWSKTTQKCATSSFDPKPTDAEKKESRYVAIPTVGNITIGSWDGKQRFDGSAATSIGNIIEKSKWFVGPLATIYTSMLDFANLTDTSNANWSERRGPGELIIRTSVAVGLLFPLIALTIVLIIRIGFLRCIIGASPLIILAYIFKWGILKDQIDPVNILRAIFAPVITVFALSMGLIFMATLQATYKTGTNGTSTLHDWLSSMGINQTIGKDGDTYDTMNIFGIVLKYPKAMNSYAGATGDWFSRMIVCFSGIGIMRFILFAAIKATWTIGAIGEKIQEYGKTMATTTPFLSIPWFNGKASISKAIDNFSPTSDKARGNASQMWWNSSFVKAGLRDDDINNKIAWIENKSGSTEETKVVEMINTKKYESAVEQITNKKNPTANEFMTGLDSNKAVEEAINKMDKKERDTFLKQFNFENSRTDRKKTEAKTAFEAKVGTPKNKTELDNLLKNTEGKNLGELNPGYQREITTEDKQKFTIKVNPSTKELEATPSK